MHNYTLIALVWLALSICFFFFHRAPKQPVNCNHLAGWSVAADASLWPPWMPQNQNANQNRCQSARVFVSCCAGLCVLGPSVCVCVFVFVLSWASPIFLFLVRFSFAFGPKAAAAAPTICINVGQVELTTLNLTETGMTWCRASFSWFLFLFYFFFFCWLYLCVLYCCSSLTLHICVLFVFVNPKFNTFVF